VAYITAIAKDYGIPVQRMGKKQTVAEVAGQRPPGVTVRAKAPPPPFLREFTWVDFRRDNPDHLARLRWGIITGIPQDRV